MRDTILKSKDKRYLKSIAHAKKPVVTIGGKGLTQAVLKELDSALAHHELLKVRIQGEDRDGRRAIANNMCATLGADLVQCLGHIATLYRPNPDNPSIQLP